MKNSDPSGEIMLTGGYNYTNNTNYNYNQWQYQSAPTIAAPTWQGTDFGAMAGSMEELLYATGVGVSNEQQYMATQMHNPPSSDAITVSLDIIAWGDDIDSEIFYAKDVIHSIVIDSTHDALVYYFSGSKESVSLGQQTQLALQANDDFIRVRNLLVNGDANSRTNTFDVNLTWQSNTFHIGDSNVDYFTSCTDANCVTRFEAFVRDGFSDPLDIGFEVYGGTPFRYTPYVFTIEYKNPGYPTGINIK